MVEFLSQWKREERKDFEKQELLGSLKELRNLRGGEEGICI